MHPPQPRTHQPFLSRRPLVRAVVFLCSAYVAVILVLLTLEDGLVFHPVPATKRWLDPPAGFAAEDVALHLVDGTALHARWFPLQGAAGAALVCHSRAGNLSLELPAEQLAGWHQVVGVSVLIFDYPGYGRSGGRPSEVGCYAAAEAAYTWLTREQGIEPSQVLLYGRSLGGAVAAELGGRRPHRALVLVSPPTSLPDVALDYFPLLPARLLMRNRFDTLARVGQCSRPVFVAHGTRDRLVSFAQGRAVCAAANEPKRFLTVEGAGHGNCVTPMFFAQVRRFLTDVEAR